MSKSKRVNDYNVAVNVDVELEEELQEEEKDTYADTEEVPPGSRRPTASADDISNYLQQNCKNFASKDTIGTFAEIKKLFDNVYHVRKSICDYIRTRRELVAEEIPQHTWLLADDTLNNLKTQCPSVDVDCVRRDRDKYLGCSDPRVRLGAIRNLISYGLERPLFSIHSEFKEVHGTLKAMTAFANETKLQSTIDDQAPTDEHFRDMMRGVHIDSPPNT